MTLKVRFMKNKDENCNQKGEFRGPVISSRSSSWWP